MKDDRALVWMATLAFVCCSASTHARQSGQSLGEAARHVKEQQKTAAKPAMVWTNDNLPTAASVSVVGQVTPAQKSAANSTGGATTAPARVGAEELSSERDALNTQLADARKDLESVQKDLDIAQREYKLDSDQHYSTPDYASDQQGQAKLDADQKQIAAKQALVEAAQKKVDELQKQMDKVKGTAAAAPSN